MDSSDLELDSVIKEVQLRPYAYFASGTDTLKFDVSDTLNGTKYQSLLNKVSFTSHGAVHATSSGFDTIIVTYNARRIKVPIRINATALSKKEVNSISFVLTDKKFSDERFVLNANASSGENITYQLISGPVDVDNGIVTIKGVGTVTIRASSTSNAYFETPVDVTRTFNILKGNQVIIFDSIPAVVKQDTTIVLKATSSSALPVVVMIKSGPGKITGDTLTATGPGQIIVQAIQNGNENYLAAQPVERIVNVNGSSPSLVKVTDFSGKLVATDIELSWQTSQEINASHFNIQRSLDKVIFTTIGRVNALGNSNTISKYSFTDNTVKNLTANKVYYRLEEVGKDAKKDYSGTISVKLSMLESKVFFSPNPANSKILVHILNHNTEENVRIRIVGVNGNIIVERKLKIPKGDSDLPINILSIPGGTYFLSIESQQLNYKSKFLKQ